MTASLHFQPYDPKTGTFSEEGSTEVTLDVHWQPEVVNLTVTPEPVKAGSKATVSCVFRLGPQQSVHVELRLTGEL